MTTITAHSQSLKKEIEQVTKSQKVNIFIVDENRSMVDALRKDIEKRFGKNVTTYTFYNEASCLQNVGKETNVVILGNFFNDPFSDVSNNGVEILKSIKKINPDTKVIMHSKIKDMDVIVESLRSGATEYIVKGKSSWSRLKKAIVYIVTEPIRIMVREFKVSKFMAIFLLTFVTMGVIVYLVLHFYYQVI